MRFFLTTIQFQTAYEFKVPVEEPILYFADTLFTLEEVNQA